MSLTYPEDRSYHSEHLWAKAEPDGTMLVGITDYAQDQLGGVIFVDLPTVGEHFKQGVSCASIESVKITSDAIIPVSGEIVAVNEALADAPELLNDSPYDKGWLVRVKPDDADEGGRISAATAAVGTMLSIKPVMHMDNEGHLVAVGKARGRKASLKALADSMEATMLPGRNETIFISHGDSLEDAEYLANLVRERTGVQDIVINYVGPVIGAHSGPGTIALFFWGSER